MTASPRFDFAAASDGEISVIFFFASATNFSKPDGITGKMGGTSKKSSQGRDVRRVWRSRPTNYFMSGSAVTTRNAALRWDRAQRPCAPDKSRRKFQPQR
jgi:hypothetical protein